MSANEEKVTVPGAASLGATIAYGSKEGKSPAVVIIMGTGKLDRDGNGPGSRMNIYRDLSDLFVEEGFVTIRYDKRGTHASSGDFSSAGLSDFVGDAVSVTEYVKALPYVDAGRVIVCGHSEGAMIATLLSQKEDVAGLMLLGGAATCLKDALRYQSRLAGEQSEERKGIVGAILRRAASKEKTDARQDELFVRCLSTEEDTIRFQGVKMSAKWIREHLSYTSEDYAGMLRAFGKPMLAITGTADLSADFRSLESIRDVPSATCYAPEGVNHILREIDDDNSIMKVRKQYLRLSARPIHQGTKETMGRWLSQFLDRSRGPEQFVDPAGPCRPRRFGKSIEEKKRGEFYKNASSTAFGQTKEPSDDGTHDGREIECMHTAVRGRRPGDVRIPRERVLLRHERAAGSRPRFALSGSRLGARRCHLAVYSGLHVLVRQRDRTGPRRGAQTVSSLG